MKRSFRVALLASALAMGCALPVLADEVYQWKDANGVTHYSQTPPPKGKYQARYIYQKAPVSEDTPAAEAPKESAQCITARKNLDLLNSGVPLLMDSDGDGKPDRELSSADRDKQLLLSQTVVRVQCSAGERSASSPTASQFGQN